MTQIVNLDGSSMATESGAVTAANSGLDRVSATGGSLAGWTYNSASTNADAPADLVANGSGNFITLEAEHTASKTARFNIASEVQHTSMLGTGGSFESLWVRCSLRSALATADHRNAMAIHNTGAGGGTKVALAALIIKGDEVATDWALDNGLGFVVGLSVARPAGSTTVGLRQTFVNPTTVNSATPIIRFGQWFKLTVHRRSHATEGRLSVYVNDTLVLEMGKFDSITANPLADEWYETDIEFPYHAKLKWEVAGPFEAHNMTGGAPSYTPRHDLVPGNSSVTQALPHVDWLDDPGDIEGTFWSYTQQVGTPAIVLTDYASGGNRPYAARAVVTGTDGDTARIKTRHDVGTLPYRTLDGWATVAFQDILVQATTNVAASFRNAADDGDLATFAIDASGNLSVNGTDTGIDLTANIHYHIALHLHLGGGCRVTVQDLTENSQNTVTWTWSAVCDDWTVGALGPIVYDIVYTTGAAGVAHQFGTVLVCETWEYAGYDSLVEADTTGLSPLMSTDARLTAGFMYQRNNAMVPGGRWTRYNEWQAIDQGRRGIACLGRSGAQQKHFLDYALPGMLHTRGARLWIMDGGSVNDSGGFTSITSPATATSFAASMKADTDSILSQWVTNQRNEVWISTMSYRTALTGWDADMESFVDQRNAGLLVSARANQSGARIQFSDTTAIVFDSTDDVHPQNEENLEVAVAMIGTMGVVAARPYSPGTRNHLRRLAGIRSGFPRRTH